MRRRDVLAVLAGTAVINPLTTEVQAAAPRVVGFLQNFKPSTELFPSADFREGLKDLGYTEGENIAFDARWTDHYEQLTALAAALVQRPVAVMVAVGHPSAVAAKAATHSIPVVFWTGADPVAQGLVVSLAHPGGNLTGLGDLSTALGAKRLELMRELVPNANAYGFLLNSANPNADAQWKDVQDAARIIGVQVQLGRASIENEIGAAFEGFATHGVDALIVAADPFIHTHREQVIALAARHRIPAMYTVPAYVSSGGLISYTSRADNQETAFRLGRYAGRILNGEKPAELPVIISTRFQMAINLKTAKALGITVPQSLLQRADEVIE